MPKNLVYQHSLDHGTSYFLLTRLYLHTVFIWFSVLVGGDQHGRERQLDSTPGHSQKLNPGAIHAVKQEGEASEALIEFYKHTLGKRVLSLQELNNKLMLHQASAPQGDPLRCVSPV